MLPHVRFNACWFRISQAGSKTLVLGDSSGASKKFNITLGHTP